MMRMTWYETAAWSHWMLLIIGATAASWLWKRKKMGPGHISPSIRQKQMVKLHNPVYCTTTSTFQPKSKATVPITQKVSSFSLPYHKLSHDR
mmetsp:Transcript_39836/g.95866  ORF Transcript_39836/g.95866 Transcript_39836/m.95866 type:complete len:92 (+) Transcript_39836:963-1238(+)